MDVDNKTSPDSLVGATYYMTYHSVLQKDSQYIAALNFSLNLADDIQKTIKNNCTTCKDVEVFPYRYVIPGCFSVVFSVSGCICVSATCSPALV